MAGACHHAQTTSPISCWFGQRTISLKTTQYANTLRCSMSVTRWLSFNLPMWPNFGRNRSRVGRSQVWPCLWSKSGRSRADVGRCRATVANVWPSLADSARFRAKIGRFRPTLDRFRVNFGRLRASVGRNWSNSGEVWLIPGRSCPKLLEIGPTSAEIGPRGRFRAKLANELPMLS